MPTPWTAYESWWRPGMELYWLDKFEAQVWRTHVQCSVIKQTRALNRHDPVTLFLRKHARSTEQQYQTGINTAVFVRWEQPDTLMQDFNSQGLHSSHVHLEIKESVYLVQASLHIDVLYRLKMSDFSLAIVIVAVNSDSKTTFSSAGECQCMPCMSFLLTPLNPTNHQHNHDLSAQSNFSMMWLSHMLSDACQDACRDWLMWTIQPNYIWSRCQRSGSGQFQYGGLWNLQGFLCSGVHILNFDVMSRHSYSCLLWHSCDSILAGKPCGNQEWDLFVIERHLISLPHMCIMGCGSFRLCFYKYFQFKNFRGCLPKCPAPECVW